MVKEPIARVKQHDPPKADWCVQGDELNVWVDASSLAIGVLLEKNGAAIEDACWLRPTNDAGNLAELDAVMKGINLALQWKVRKLRIHTDSLCVYHWISDTLAGKARVRTKATSEMLIRRRLETIRKLVTEYTVSKSAVRAVVKECQTCQSIDPAPAKWRKGRLGTDTTWSRLGMDITHYGSQHFLTLIDCGPTRFAVWCPLVRQDSSSVIHELESIFYERGPPKEILTDNDTAFCS